MKRTTITIYTALCIMIALLLLVSCGGDSDSAASAADGVAPACSDAIGCVTVAPDEPLKIAALQSQSGPTADLGAEMEHAIQFALTEPGELLGHKIELLAEDSGCSPESGTTGALRVVADTQVVGIIGTTCSGAAETAAKIMSEAGMVMISGSNTAPALTFFAGKRGASNQPGYYRTAHNDQYSGAAAAHYAFEALGVHKAASLNDGDPFTEGLTQVFEMTFQELGGEIVLSTAVNKEDADMVPVLESVVDTGAELLYFPIFRPAGDYVLRQSKEVAGFDKIALMSAEGLAIDPYFKEMDDDASGMYFAITGQPQTERYAEFTEKFTAQYSPPATPFYGHTYDATKMLLQAIEAVAQQSDDGTLIIGRQALRDYLSQLKDFEGVTGKLACDEYGDCAAVRIDVMRLDDPAGGLEGLRGNVVFSFVPDK